MKKFGWILGIAAMLATATAIAMNTRGMIAEQAVKSVRNEAKIAYLHEDWPEAEKKFRHLIDQDPNNAEAVFMLGFSIHYQQRYKEARDYFVKAEELGYDKGLCQYNIACGYAQLGEREMALTHFRAAITSGFNMLDWAAADPDMASLHKDPEFRKLIEQAKKHNQSGQRCFPMVSA